MAGGQTVSSIEGRAVLQSAEVERSGSGPPRGLAVLADARFAFWAFAAAEVGALGTFLYLGSHQWFYLDEWDFLADRSLGFGDVLRSHNGHPSMLPIIAYRMLFRTVGLHSYLPYALLAIVAHLAVAALLRTVMRRAGVNPWLATAAASLFAFFGAGGQDIVWGFQIGFSGAVLFGLVQLVLADHDGGIDRRDWWGLAAGLLALSCSNVGVSMVLVVGVATLIRRGWRIALFHMAPLLAIYFVWSSRYGADQQTTSDPELLVRWVWHGLSSTFDALGQAPFVGWLLLAMLVAGLVVAWQSADPPDRRRRFAAPVALLVGAVGFFVVTGFGRAMFGPEGAGVSRYLHIGAALVVAPLAVAGDALWRRHRALTVVVLALFLIGIPGNIAETRSTIFSEGFYNSIRATMTSAPRLRLARTVPGSLQIDPNQAPDVTMRWLRGALRAGRLPEPHEITPKERATVILQVSLRELNRGDAGGCAPMTENTNVPLQAGQKLVVHGSILVWTPPQQSRAASGFVTFGASLLAGQRDHTLVALSGPLLIRIAPASPGAAVCRA